jgi:hypothetical protein
MTLEEAARQFKMPLDDLKKMRGEGILSDPLAPHLLQVILIRLALEPAVLSKP